MSYDQNFNYLQEQLNFIVQKLDALEKNIHIINSYQNICLISFYHNPNKKPIYCYYQSGLHIPGRDDILNISINNRNTSFRVSHVQYNYGYTEDNHTCSNVNVYLSKIADY